MYQPNYGYQYPYYGAQPPMADNLAQLRMNANQMQNADAILFRTAYGTGRNLCRNQRRQRISKGGKRTEGGTGLETDGRTR